MSEPRASAWSVLAVFARLGLTSFGGPVAHLGFFREEFVLRRRWLSDAAYAELVALCQFLPGPASSQVGMALGLMRAGMPGLLAAWLGFTLPSALILFAVAMGLLHGGASSPLIQGAVQGLAAAALAVVAHATWGMARTLCPDRRRQTLMLVCTAALLLAPPVVWAGMAVIAFGAFAGVWLTPTPPASALGDWPLRVSRRTGVSALVLLALGLLWGPVWAHSSGAALVTLADTCFRAGAWVFGGGHVVLPFLQAELVGPSGADAATFMAGYGAAQAVPGPLFTFAAFTGAVMPGADGQTLGGAGALTALLAVFAPGALWLVGVLPFWGSLRRHAAIQRALMGANAAVVAWLLVTLIGLVSEHGTASWPQGLVALLSGALLWGRWPAWAVVLSAGAVGSLLL
ncbi:MAG: chromate transport protein ChrA [Pseudomonadota bacterium]